MQYDFDTVIDRHGTNSVKYDKLDKLYGRSDLSSLWVADMDFATPDFIVEALARRLAHPIYGYTFAPDSYWQSIIDWLASHHQWNVKREWLAFIPGIVKGIGLVEEVMTKPGDRVIVQPPIYHPFHLVTKGNGREVVWNPLKETKDGYAMDFDQLERVIDGAKLLILSNPHNPAGIVWCRETLARLARVCHEHHVIVVSDEIHCDMALYGHKHVPFASVSEEAAQNSITFGAPSKTFNIAGIVSSWAVVPNEAIRKRFFSWLETNELDAPTFFATIATEAAFTKGEDWRRQMVKYVEGNVDFVADYVARNIPGIRVVKPEASYLVWLDCRALGLAQKDLVDLFVNGARLALNDGAMFGPGGEGHMRLNIGCPRSILVAALESLRIAVEKFPVERAR